MELPHKLKGIVRDVPTATAKSRRDTEGKGTKAIAYGKKQSRSRVAYKDTNVTFVETQIQIYRFVDPCIMRQPVYLFHP